MEGFLDSLLPNSLYFYNRILKRDYPNLSNITKEDYKNLILELKKMGLFLPVFINKNNYEFTDIEKTKYYTVSDQHNKIKNTTMKVMVLKNMMMLDYDGISLEEVKNFLKKSNEKYEIYKTFNGYHAYCLSKSYYFRDYKTLQIMKTLGCDELYISYCYNLGVCVRLSKKQDREEDYIEEYVCSFGNNNENDTLRNLLIKKDKLLQN
jgi:hypothetical protein